MNDAEADPDAELKGYSSPVCGNLTEKQLR